MHSFEPRYIFDLVWKIQIIIKLVQAGLDFKVIICCAANPGCKCNNFIPKVGQFNMAVCGAFHFSFHFSKP